MRKPQKQVPSPRDRINSPSLPALRLPAPQGAGWEGAKPTFWASGLASLAGLQVCRQPGQREESLPPSCDPSTLAWAAPPSQGADHTVKCSFTAQRWILLLGRGWLPLPGWVTTQALGKQTPCTALLSRTAPLLSPMCKGSPASRRMADPPPSPSLQIRR